MKKKVEKTRKDTGEETGVKKKREEKEEKMFKKK